MKDETMKDRSTSRVTDEEINLIEYWRVLSKRRILVLTIFSVVVGVVMVYSFTATPIYQGTARLLLKIEENPATTFGQDVSLVRLRNLKEYYRTHKGIFESRAFADRVVRKLQLNNNPYFLDKKAKRQGGLILLASNWFKQVIETIFPQSSPSLDSLSKLDNQQELDPDLTDILLKEMGIESENNSNIFKINYRSENPGVAAAVANGIAQAYIEHNLEIQVRPFRDAVEWLSARMVELRAKVEDSERNLQSYRETQGIVSFEAKENIITQKLKELVSQMVKTEGKRQEAEARYNQIKSVIDRPDLLTTVPDIMNNLVIQGLRTEELKLKKEISELSKKYGPKHPNMVKTRSELDMVQKNLIKEAKKMLHAARTEYEIIMSREASLRMAIEAQKKEVLNLSRKAIEFNVVAGEAETNKKFYEILLKKLREASLSSGISMSNVQVIDRAVIPKSPIKPKRNLNIVMAIIVGLFSSIFTVFFIEYMDDTIKTPEDVEGILGLPLLGFVPSSNEKGYMYMSSGYRSVTAEAYRTIRTSIMLSYAEKSPKVILITSTIPNEGKTTTSTNLAVAMSQMGERVLLIDADMRRHNLHKAFTLDNSIGLSNLIAGQSKFPAAVKTIPDLPNLSIVTGGTVVPNPVELLSSKRMKAIMNGLRERYDRIILDSPPIMAFSDPLILSSLADGVILVAWGGVTSGDIISKAGRSLKGVNAKILGVVLNNLSMAKRHNRYYYPYYYSSYYADEKDKREKINV